jgi:hypothetical protein
MSWVVTAVVATAAFQVGSVVLQQKASRKAQKEAKADAIEAEKQARKAEVFAETEGEGVGSLGQISLEVDDDEVKSEVGSTIRI